MYQLLSFRILGMLIIITHARGVAVLWNVNHTAASRQGIN